MTRSSFPGDAVPSSPLGGIALVFRITSSFRLRLSEALTLAPAAGLAELTTAVPSIAPEWKQRRMSAIVSGVKGGEFRGMRLDSSVAEIIFTSKLSWLCFG